MFGEKLDVGRREDLFFGLPPMFGGKLDVGAPDADFGGGHALPSFGPGWQTNTIWNRYFDKTNLLLSVISR